MSYKNLASLTQHLIQEGYHKGGQLKWIEPAIEDENKVEEPIEKERGTNIMEQHDKEAVNAEDGENGDGLSGNEWSDVEEDGKQSRSHRKLRQRNLGKKVLKGRKKGAMPMNT